MRRRDERGQATVEFALVIPLVVVVLLVIIQLVMVAYAQLSVTHIARETARALAVDPSLDIDHLTQETAPLGTEGLSIQVFFESSPVLGRKFVVVTVFYQVAPVSRLFDSFTTQLRVSAEVKMLAES